MTNDEYFDQFNDSDKNHVEDVSSGKNYPEWVSANNSSLAAYEAIKSLYSQKMAYIRNHKKKYHYQKKKVYQINKSEVARAAGLNKPNSLFNSKSVSYAVKLTIELEEKNNALLKTKDKILSGAVTGLNHKTRKELISEVRERDRFKEIAQTRADELLALTLKHLPLDTKRRLGLI